MNTDTERLARMGTDASQWAKEFVETFGNRRDDIDEGVMLGWFANAIEAGRDAGLAAN